jgi:hypothetical protein
MRNLNRYSRNGNPPRRGVVLLIVLVVLVVLTFSAYTFTELMRTHNTASDLSGQQVQARLLAESGVEAVRLFLMQTPSMQAEAGGHYYNTLYFQARNVLPDVDPERVGNFTVLAPLIDEMGNLAAVRYGLEDESARLNVNILVLADELISEGGRTLLTALPAMTDDIADAILDWIDEDDETRPFGAERDYYEQLDPPYTCKNGPLDTVEELLLIRGVTPQMLFGKDSNRNGMLDAHEFSPQATATVMDPTAMAALTDETFDPLTEGSLDRGWSGYLTLHSQELNTNINGEKRIFLNTDDLQLLHEDLNATFGIEVANFVIAYRQADGDYSGEEEGVQANTITVDKLAPATRTLNQVLDLVDARVEFPSPDGEGMLVLNSPFPLLAMGGYIDKMMDNMSISEGRTIPGRLNINQAPRSLLMGIPGISEEIVEGILSNRVLDPNSSGLTPQDHETWLMTALVVDIEKMKLLQPFICAGGDVFRAQVVGYFEGGAAASRVEIVIDRTNPTPRIVFWRDLSHLGRGYPLDVLGYTYREDSLGGTMGASIMPPLTP